MCASLLQLVVACTCACVAGGYEWRGCGSSSTRTVAPRPALTPTRRHSPLYSQITLTHSHTHVIDSTTLRLHSTPLHSPDSTIRCPSPTYTAASSSSPPSLSRRLAMSASSSLSRLEFVLNSVEMKEQQFNGGNQATSGAAMGSGVAKSISSFLPSWGGGTKSLPAPAGLSSPGGGGGGATGTGAAAAASASALASSAAASAQHAAARVGHSASEWFGQLSAKVTGKEHVPAALPSSGADIEEGSTLLPSADPGGPTSGLAAQFNAEFSALTSLSWRQRLVAFAMCVTCGLVMLSLSFMYLSLVFVGAPAKFSLCYAMANMFLLASSLFLVGPTKQLSQMFSAQRAPVSAVYLSSLLLLFYVSWQWRSFFIVVPVLIIQFASLAAYVLSYVPFGQGPSDAHARAIAIARTRTRMRMHVAPTAIRRHTLHLQSRRAERWAGRSPLPSPPTPHLLLCVPCVLLCASLCRHDEAHLQLDHRSPAQLPLVVTTKERGSKQITGNTRRLLRAPLHSSALVLFTCPHYFESIFDTNLHLLKRKYRLCEV